MVGLQYDNGTSPTVLSKGKQPRPNQPQAIVIGCWPVVVAGRESSGLDGDLGLELGSG